MELGKKLEKDFGVLREGLIFKIVNAWGIANNYVYCNSELNLYLVEVTEDDYQVTQRFIGRFSNELFQEGLKKGCIMNVYDTKDL